MRRWFLALVAALSAALPVAPATAAGGSVFGTLPPGAQRIHVSDPGLVHGRQVHIRFSDLWQTEDYALFQGSRMQAEFIYATADRGLPIVLDVPFNLRRATALWTVNRAERVATSRVERVERRGTLFWQTYRLAGSGWSCVSVFGEWDFSPRDTLNRPKQMLTGYVCDTSGDGIDMVRAQRIVAGLDVRLAVVPVPMAAAVRSEPAQQLRAFASGGAGNAGKGVQRFPLRLATHKWLNEGGRRGQ